jgi:1,4-alpha-glucan branching enzyme
LRELLALQSSDWAFLAHRRTAGDYPRERARGHAAALAEVLAGRGGGDAGPGNLAPDLAGWLV